MCGIAGVFAKEPFKDDRAGAMIQALIHRGPDVQAVYVNATGTVALGHSRLSIIDLSQSANQPMISRDGRYVLVFNGEIYNYKSIRKELVKADPSISFSTASDTETVLQAFIQRKEKMLPLLEGMFSIVIYDMHDNVLFMCRDRLGKKPLFYCQTDKAFVFASEIKSILRYPLTSNEKKVSINAVHNFLHLGYIPEPRTIFDKIKKFPAASFAWLRSNFEFEIQKYWKAEDFAFLPRSQSALDPVKQLKDILTNAVVDRLVSDVPLGAFLSGGTDSSIISAIASKFSHGRLKTFSIGFKDKKFDETHYAAEVARHLNTDHYSLMLEEKDALQLMDAYLSQYDEPFADTSAIPTMLVSKFARTKVTVALTGDGGDELFLGYGAYNWASRLASPFYKASAAPLSAMLRTTGNSRLRRISHMFQPVQADQRRSHIFSQEQYLFSAAEIRTRLLRSPETYHGFTYRDDPSSLLTEAENQALFDLNFYLKDDLLVKVDRASMLYALECRCPLLDRAVVEFALQLPVKYKRRDGVAKWILKELLSEYLPKHLVHRQKWGFSIPLAKWMKNDLRYLIDTYLDEKTVDDIGLFKKDFISGLKKSFLLGNQDFLYNRLWVLILVHKWLKENG